MNHIPDCKTAFTSELIAHMYTADDAKNIFELEMNVRAFFEFGDYIPAFLKLQNIERESGEIFYFWESSSTEAQCPSCGTLSTAVCNDYYCKPIQDIPQGGDAVYHEVRLKKYYCKNPECIQKRFVERLQGFAEEDARKTNRFVSYCVARSLECSCNGAERSIRSEGAKISNDTIARYLKAESAKTIESNLKNDQVKIISVDDINLRKGDKSSGCTVFIDEETHRVLVIIKGTTKEATKRALDKFPSVQFFSRDRASAYSSAAEECGITQIADRFHLIKNAQAAVKDALMMELPVNVYVRSGEGWIAMTSNAGGPDEKQYFCVADEDMEERVRIAKLTPAMAKKYRNTLRVLELADKGMKSPAIAQIMRLSSNDIRGLRRVAVKTLTDVEDRIKKNIQTANDKIDKHHAILFEHDVKTIGPNARPSCESVVEPFRAAVIEQLRMGGNHRTIYPIICEQGFIGSCNAVYQYILKLRKEIPDEVKQVEKSALPDLTLESFSRDKVYHEILKEAAKSRKSASDDGNIHNSDLSGAVDRELEKQVKSNANKSPLSDMARTVIYGDDPNNKENTQEEDKDQLKKNYI